MKKPLAGIAIVFCLGIFFARQISMPFFWVYSFSAVFLITGFIFFKKRMCFNFVLPGLIFCLGILAFQNSRILPRCHISRFVYYKDNTLYKIKGVIDSQPAFKNGRGSFLFKAQEMESGVFKQNCCGNIIAYVKGKGDFKYGEALMLSGTLSRLRKQSYFYSQGILAAMRADSIRRIIRLNYHPGFSLKKFALQLKEKLEKIILCHTSKITAGVLEAMLLGDKKYVPPLLYQAMMKSGTVHILVVSGFNVGIVAFIVGLFLKLLRMPRRLRFCLAIACLILYCLLTGASTPVVRATVMGIFFIFGFLLKREPDICNSCALAAIFILAANPRQLFDIGFQLSFASVLSIIYLYPRLRALLSIGHIKIKYLRFMLDGCLVSLSAWLGTMGFIAYYFKIFSPITVVANIFIVPLAALITLCGFSLVFTALIFPALAPLFSPANELLVILLLKIDAFLIKVPGACFYLFDKASPLC